MRFAASVLTVVLVFGGAAVTRAEDTHGPDTVVTVELKDGTRLVGRVIEEDESRLRVRTLEGLDLEVPRGAVTALRVAGETRETAVRLDPNYSRLMFAPTGRPLRKGDGYFSDYELMFPGVAVGVTDHFSLAGGVSVIPGLGLGEQLFYVSPKLGHQVSDRLALSLGGLYATASAGDDRQSLGVLFGVGTLGGRNRSLTVGLGLGDGELEGGFRPSPILMLGGTATVSRHLALVTESWFVLRDDFELGEQPLGVGVRFFGDRLSADVGLVVIPEYLDEGGFFPWASISYHFGPGRREARRGHR